MDENPARGIVIGLFISAGFWLIFGYILLRCINAI
jgi:hypothetical protein